MSEKRLGKAIPVGFIAWAAVVTAVVAAMYWRVAGYFAHRWIAEDTYHHCLFVAPVVAWLIYRRRRELAKLRVRPSWAGVAALAGAGLLYLVATRIGVRVAIGFSFPVVIVGLMWATLGNGYARLLAYPLGLLVFLTPVPKHMLGHIGMPLQVASAEGAAKAAHVIGLPVAHDGIDLTLHGFTFKVAEECSGLSSLVALLFAGAVMVEIMNIGRWARLVLLLTPAIVLAANTVRLTSVLLFAEFAGPQFALDSLVHGGSDVIVYLAALMFMWLLIDLASERRLLAILLARDEGDAIAEREAEAGMPEVAAWEGAERAGTKEERANGNRVRLETVCK